MPFWSAFRQCTGILHNCRRLEVSSIEGSAHTPGPNYIPPVFLLYAPSRRICFSLVSSVSGFSLTCKFLVLLQRRESLSALEHTFWSVQWFWVWKAVFLCWESLPSLCWTRLGHLYHVVSHPTGGSDVCAVVAFRVPCELSCVLDIILGHRWLQAVQEH